MLKILQLDSIRDFDKAILTEANLRGERQGRLEAIYGRIENRLLYLSVEDVFEVAAIYATYIAIGHPFKDGNKRTAFVAMDTILYLNGYELKFADDPAKDLVFDLLIKCARNKANESTLAAHLRSRFLQ